MNELASEIKSLLVEKVSPSHYNNGMLDIDSLCEDLGLTLKEATFGNPQISGVLKNESGSWTIYVNAIDSLNRKRFTAAHEIGHYLSYLAKSKSFDVLSEKDFIQEASIWRNSDQPLAPKEKQAETEANRIASEILMPVNDVKKLFEEGQTVEYMADQFGVSELAMSIRLEQLDYKLYERV